MSTTTGPDIALRVLSTVEELPPDATGALVYGPAGSMSGVVLVEHGRVCWAAGTGLRQRLTDLLREACSPAMTAVELEAFFLECRTRGQPIGEALVAHGRLSPANLRAALLQHTAESLSLPGPWAAVPHFVPHKARGYASAFTFRPVELLAFASAAALGEEAASSALGQLFELVGTRHSALFDKPGEVLLACQLPEEDAAPTALRELRAAGAWASESLVDADHRGAALKFTMDGRGGVWLGWREDGLTYLVRCRDRDDFSLMVRTLMRRGRDSAVHSSVAFVPP
ncbi:MAG: hypothetical protein QM817_25010 [Archangium sp.]